tara:strand:+ start:592 stop:1524 length:933 start_codon:yes stop_codon:yes gene_type:complete
MTTINANLTAQVGCQYILQTRKGGVVTKETPPCFNVITDYGMNAFASGTGALQYCHVGSGNATPAFTDIALQSRIASVRDTGRMEPSIDTVGRWLLLEKTFTFPAGTATGNISEVGVGRSETTNLASRALVVDGSGDPTTITVLADEDLVVTYRIWVKQPTGDFTGTADGKTYTVRAARANASTQGSGSFQGYWGENQYTQDLFEWADGNQRFAVYDGALGSVTGLPSGSSDAISSSAITASAYVADSYTNEITAAISSALGNFATGISAVAWSQGICAWQMSIDPPLVKVSPQTARIAVTTTWARDAGP